MTIAFNEPKMPMNSILWISCHLKISRDFPGSPGLQKQCFHRRGRRFNLWVGN